jgi:hypothetical protein
MVEISAAVFWETMRTSIFGKSDEAPTKTGSAQAYEKVAQKPAKLRELPGCRLAS